MRALYCSKEKTDSEGDTAHLRLNKSNLVSLLDVFFIVIRSEKLRPEKVTSFFAFLSLIKSNDGYQIGRRVSHDTRNPIFYHVMCSVQ